MEIRTKFKVNDKVFSLTTVFAKEDCPDCNGVAELKFNNIYYICKKCHGSGKIETMERIWILNNNCKKVCKIVVTEREKKEIYYLDSDDNFIALEEDCFSTREEAQKECDRRNWERMSTEEINAK